MQLSRIWEPCSKRWARVNCKDSDESPSSIACVNIHIVLSVTFSLLSSTRFCMMTFWRGVQQLQLCPLQHVGGEGGAWTEARGIERLAILSPASGAGFPFERRRWDSGP